MKKNFFGRENVVFILSLIVILLSTTSCKEDPIAPQEEHIKAIGMVFYTSGIEVARILKGVTIDTLIAPLDGLSDHLDIKFIDEEGKEFSPPSTATQTLAWEFENSSIADVWQHEGEEGGFEFHLKGLQIGETNVEFFVMHNDHSDYRSGKIPVRVVNDNGAIGEPIGLNLSDSNSGNTLVSINDSIVVGELNINSSDTTNALDIIFFDSQNNYFQPDAPPHSLFVEVADESIVKVLGQEENTPWTFKMVGLKTGVTNIIIKILHEGNVGVSFEQITVNVN